MFSRLVERCPRRRTPTPTFANVRPLHRARARGNACTPSATALSQLPEHLRHGAVAQSLGYTAAEDDAAPQYIDVPLDHFSSGGPTWRLKFYVADKQFEAGGTLLVTMPSEGATGGCGGGSLAKALKAAAICSQHRYFGDSVPNNDSSTAAFSKYLSVEQNLADIAALITHARAKLFPTASAVVVQGGSYAGASSAWMRHAYPKLVDAAIAQSPPVTAMYDFYQYDVSNLVALSSPDSRCANTQAKIAAALTSLLSKQPTKLLALFGAPHFATAPMGLVDFMYALGDSSASAIQYGRKAMLCEALAPIYSLAGGGKSGAKEEEEEWALAKVFANYTKTAWGSNYFNGCFYNSSCMATSTEGPVAQSARSWYWMKCAHLGYLQTAPQNGSLSTRPTQLTVGKLMEQCKYIFGQAADLITPSKIAAFNAKHGGGKVGGESKIFEIDYSDDPWKMATTSITVERSLWPLSIDQPFMLLTCDGCGHCGSGVPEKKSASIDEQVISYLASWGIGPPDPTPPSQEDEDDIVLPTDARITYHGRWAFPEEKVAACAWPMSGFSFSLAVGSTGCSARLTAPDDGARLLIVVNGEAQKYLKLEEQAPSKWYQLVDGLSPEMHYTVEVYKVTEDNTFGREG